MPQIKEGEDVSEVRKWKKAFSLTSLLISLIILCQPNISILDVFPDFIAFFILAKMMGSAASVLPYLEEAKSAYYKLAFFDIFRFFAQFFLFSSANADSRTNNMALCSFTFSIVEFFFIINAIHYTFEAVFYLGERSDCPALIHPYKIWGIEIKPEHLEYILDTFFGLKAFLTFLPDGLRLFQKGNTFSLYRNSVFVTVAIGLIAGTVTVILTFAYIRSIKKENRFSDGLQFLYQQNVNHSLESGKKQKLSAAFLFMFVSTVFTIFLPTDSLGEADLFPGFLFPIFFLIGISHLGKVSTVKKSLKIVGIVLSVVSFVSFVFRPVFFAQYSLTDIAKIPAAEMQYRIYEGICLLECIVTAVFLLLICKNFDVMIESETGVRKDSNDYRKTDLDYHNGLKKINHATIIFGFITLLSRTLKILSDSSVSTFFVSQNNTVIGSVSMSAIPWIVVVVNFSAVLFAASFYYFSSTIKDEWNI